MQKIFRTRILLAFAAVFTLVSSTMCANAHESAMIVEEPIEYDIRPPIFEILDDWEKPVDIPEPEPEPEEELATQEEIELIALVTMAEAEGECEEGKRLVIDTILNRVDSEHFPDTIYDVVYQPNQFSSMWNGRSDRCEVREDICQLVREELESRYNSDCVFFRAYRYSDYGVPMFQVGGHYFSSYE